MDDFELALTDPVTEPVEAHIDGLGASDFEGIVGEAHSGCVVNIDDCGAVFF